MSVPSTVAPQRQRPIRPTSVISAPLTSSGASVIVWKSALRSPTPRTLTRTMPSSLVVIVSTNVGPTSSAMPLLL
jgi:hypothetical protein